MTTSVLVALDVNEQGESVLVVGRQTNGKMVVVNASVGKTGVSLYNQLLGTTPKEGSK